MNPPSREPCDPTAEPDDGGEYQVFVRFESGSSTLADPDLSGYHGREGRPDDNGWVVDNLFEEYVALLNGCGWLRNALCWTVVMPDAADVGIDQVLDRLGVGAQARLGFAAPQGVAGRAQPSLACVDQIGGAVVLLEVNGYRGSLAEVLERVSVAACACSAYWNVNGVSQLSYAVDGRVLTWLEGPYPEDREGIDPDALNDHLTDVFRTAETAEGAGDWQAAMLAAVERRTGVGLRANWLTTAHLVVALAGSTDPPGSAATADLNLAAWLRERPEPARRDALARLLALAREAVGGVVDSAIEAGIRALRAGEAVDATTRRALFAMRDRLIEEQARSGIEPGRSEDMSWRRAQAGWALTKVLCAAEWQDPLEGVQHAQLALGSSWPDAVQQIVRECS